MQKRPTEVLYICFLYYWQAFQLLNCYIVSYIFHAFLYCFTCLRILETQAFQLLLAIDQPNEFASLCCGKMWKNVSKIQIWYFGMLLTVVTFKGFWGIFITIPAPGTYTLHTDDNLTSQYSWQGIYSLCSNATKVFKVFTFFFGELWNSKIWTYALTRQTRIYRNIILDPLGRLRFWLVC